MSTTAAKKPRCLWNPVARMVRREEGIALVFVLLALSIFFVLVMSFLVETTVQGRLVAASRDHQTALYTAEAGIQEALVRINARDRSLTRAVNGGNVRVWIPIDTRTVGTDGSDPALWRFVHDDQSLNLDIPALGEIPGFDTVADDWAEYDPEWQAFLWYASPAIVAATFTTGNHYPTLVDLTTRPEGLVRRLLVQRLDEDTPEAAAGVQLRWEKDDSGAMLFTDGLRRFTARQGKDDLGVQDAWPVIEAVATGRAGRAQRRLVAEIARFPIRLPHTALYSCGETLPAFPGSGSMTVSGFDYPPFDPNTGLPAGTLLTGTAVYSPPLDPAQAPPVPAVTVCCQEGAGRCADTGDEDLALQAQLGSQSDLFGADTGDGDSVQVGELNVRDLFEAYTYSMPSDHDYAPDSVGDLGDANRFVVSRIHATGGVQDVAGPDPMVSGGVLLLDTGDDPNNVLRFEADAVFYGLVLVIGRGEVSFRHSLRVFGLLATSAEIDVQDSAQIYYSSQALRKIEPLQVHRVLRLAEPDL
jgi:hypothetical protein